MTTHTLLNQLSIFVPYKNSRYGGQEGILLAKTGRDLYRNGSPEVMTDTSVDSLTAKLDGTFELANREMTCVAGFSKVKLFL